MKEKETNLKKDNFELTYLRSQSQQVDREVRELKTLNHGAEDRIRVLEAQLQEERMAGAEASRRFEACAEDWRMVRQQLEHDNQKLRHLISRREEAERARRELLVQER